MLHAALLEDVIGKDRNRAYRILIETGETRIFDIVYDCLLICMVFFGNNMLKSSVIFLLLQFELITF